MHTVLTRSLLPIAASKEGSTVPRWESRPGPATSAKAPKACALNALEAYMSKIINAALTYINIILIDAWTRYIRKRRLDKLRQDMRQDSHSPDTEQ